jgi:hypothetical protein
MLIYVVSDILSKIMTQTRWRSMINPYKISLPYFEVIKLKRG